MDPRLIVVMYALRVIFVDCNDPRKIVVLFPFFSAKHIGDDHSRAVFSLGRVFESRGRTKREFALRNIFILWILPERGIELPIMFPGIMGCIRVQLTNAAHLIDSHRSPHLFCRVDDY